MKCSCALSISRLASAAVLLCCFETQVVAQPTYRGLKLGEASRADVIAALGTSPIRCGHADDLRYPVPGNDALSDRLYFRDDRLALVTAASVDSRYPNRATIGKLLGPDPAVKLRTSSGAQRWTSSASRPRNDLSKS